MSTALPVVFVAGLQNGTTTKVDLVAGYEEENNACTGQAFNFKGDHYWKHMLQQCGAESGSEQTQYVVDRKERENKFMLGMRQPDCYWKKRKISYCRKQKREMRRKELT